ncbi:hypothetical protein Gorai_011927 [Gossypium raimondii]|uniref:Uncharacterized protein n=1 Tax=Gossypium raimondii TaxID=29730 RepID=A0A0D2S1M4_GOSRA|nr:hypothetical protein B456_009G153100 [Gossypium raimondii]MBA0595048.1 hypothetical protein [Gossypium raimondii]
MANSRIPRFVMEVAPPQFITVMRHRTRKMLDTISEEDKDGSSYNDSLSAASKASATVPVGAMPAAAANTVTANSKYILKGLSSFSNFNN